MNSKKLKSVVNNLRKMSADDSLKVTQNEDGSFTMDWDPQDPRWSWMNQLTQKEIQVIMEQAIKDYLDELERSPQQ